MEATIHRKRTTITLPDYMLADLGNEAKRRKTTVSRLLECFMEPMLYKPNTETLEAIQEARSGAEMEELTPYNIEHFEEWVASKQPTAF